METQLDAIRAAVAADATEEAKAAGVAACRTILGALEARPHEPLVAAKQPADLIAAAVSLMRSVPAEQLLDLMIARLRAALPADQAVSAVQRLHVPLVQLPQIASKP
jgi:hypothetical protein